MTTPPALSKKYKSYPAYKDSSAEWLSNIPAHWKMQRLKNIASVELSNVDKKSVEGQKPVRLCNYVDVYYNECITAKLDFMTATATPEQVRRFALRKGDVLITKDSESWTDIAVPAVVSEDLPGVICGYHLAHIRPGKEYNGAFLSRAFAAIGPRDQFQVAANGITRFGLGSDAIRTSLFVTPPPNEQGIIANFLDRETAKIDALVAKKERLIELLQEKRAALITHAVTKGLDPAVPMKDSGVEWLGQIPAHWKIKKLKYVVKDGFVNGLFKKKDQYGTGVKLINVVNLYEKNFLIDFDTLEYVEADREELITFQVSPGDIFFVRSSLKLEGVGSSACATAVPEPAVFECHLVRVRPSQTHISPEHLVYCLNSSLVRQRLIALAETTTMTTIAQPKLASLDIVVPSHLEQRAIVVHLDRETAKLDALVAKVREGIEKLKEYRTALISAAVTGKIDVREAV